MRKFHEIVCQTISEFEMIIPGDSILVAVSGGPDSAALIYLLSQILEKFKINKLAIAHINHMLRSNDSDNDEIFVKKLSQKLNLPFYSKKIDVKKFCKDNKLSIEEGARLVRYDFLENTAKNNKYSKIALGHILDDNVELVLMNMLRGSGMLGASGIPPKRDNIFIRPLINVTRLKIYDFLKENKIDYVIDKSNYDNSFSRNKIRNKLIPILEKDYNPKIKESLNRFSQICRQDESWITTIVKDLFNETIIFEDNDKIVFNVLKLKNLHIAAQKRLLRFAIQKLKKSLKKITFFHIKYCLSLLSDNKRQKIIDLPDDIKVSRKDNMLEIINLENSQNDTCNKFEYIIKKPCKIFLKEINASIKTSELKIKTINDINFNNKNVAYFDADLIQYPLFIRNFKKGDNFTPFGMNGMQKLKKFFINNKIPREKKLDVPILLCKDKIMWVVGYRIDNFFCIKSLTKNILKAEFEFV